MDPGFLLIENFGRFSAIVGMMLATPAFAYAGYLWVSSMGDPNRSAVARNSVISVCVGILVIGLAFLVPNVISDEIVEPAGGTGFQLDVSVNCDQIFRDQVVANSEVSNANRMAFVVQRIQSTFDDCHSAMWDPVVRTEGHNLSDECFDSSAREYISGVEIPPGLASKQAHHIGHAIVNASARDSLGNVIVHWTHSNVASVSRWGLPSDGAVCWMYIRSIDTWVEGY